MKDNCGLKKKKSKKREENNFKFLKERLRFDGGPANLSVGSLSSGAENMIWHLVSLLSLSPYSAMYLRPLTPIWYSTEFLQRLKASAALSKQPLTYIFRPQYQVLPVCFAIEETPVLPMQQAWNGNFWHTICRVSGMVQGPDLEIWTKIYEVNDVQGKQAGF